MSRIKKKKHQRLQQIARKLIVRTNPKSVISEQFRTLRTNIKFSMPVNELKTILVTSSSMSEGKSTISANLACLFAEEGNSVLLIDADLRKPTMQYTFKINNAVGLSNILTFQAILEEAIKPSEIPNLDLLPSGPIPVNPADLLGSKAMDDTIERLRQIYDYIIFDAPPVLAVTDAQLIANQCDGTILALNSGLTKKEAARKTLELLKGSNTKIIGAVLNNHRLERNHYYAYENE
ncbi:CpsD/CapB family tyrosine-protein kinase [Rummeliibacillus sp. JY-2-4R]